MQALNFALVRERSKRIKAIAGPYLERLAERASIAEWLAGIEAEDAEAAEAVRSYIGGVDAHDRERYLRREDLRAKSVGLTLGEMLSAMNTDPWVGVGREIPAGNKRFDNFEPRPGHPLVQTALESVRAWVGGAVEEPMLTLGGVPGAGKTHLAEAAAVELAETGHPCIYRTEAGLMAEAMRRMETKDTEELLSAVCEVGWLVLDDLGVAALSDWGRGVMDRIINARYGLAQERAGYTLITTNVSGGDLSARVLRRLNEPGVSRVLELLRVTSFYGGGR